VVVSDAARERGATAALGLLLALLPFEPLEPLFRAAGLGFTLLEVAAAAATLVLAGLYGRGLIAQGWRGALPAPVLALAAFAAANLLAAAFASEHRGPALIFSLRMAAAALFAAMVAALPPRVHERGLAALALAGAACAALAVLEAGGVGGLDAFLGLFRERAFAAGAARRATAGTAGPTVGAAFIAAGTIAGAACLAVRRRPLAVGFAVAGSLGLVATYSRGGLAAAAAGMAALAWAQPRGSAPRRSAALALAAVLVIAGASLASPAFRPRLVPEWRWRGLSAQYGLAGPPPRFDPGAATRVRLRVTNDGPAWPADPTFALGVGWFDPREGQARQWSTVALGGPVAPGRSAEVEAELRAPGRAGSYALVLNVTSASTGYLSLSGVAPGFVPVPVGAPGGEPAVRPAPAATGRRGRWEMWRIALAMWRAHPILGVGPDNFRRLDWRYGGWIAQGNVPLGAHNAFLEAAATTGTLGLLALCAVFAATARAALRAGASSASGEPVRPAAVLGLIVALAVQGLVDSLLGFTGVYLLLAFVTGTAGALQVSRRAVPGTAPPPAAAAR
jgi:O-antigen ligase/polysaccharide polymerase Wzy-like membrane protein